MNAAEFDTAIGAFVAAKAAAVSGRSSVTAVAVDGKTTRGARTADTVAPHFLAAMDMASRTVIGQLAVGEKTNETRV